MTEIVQNNNSMKIDLLEVGNSGTALSESNSFFNSLLGEVDVNGEEDMQNSNTSDKEKLHADGNILEILNLLKESELNLNEETLNEIKTHLKDLFEKITLDIEVQKNLKPEQKNGLEDKNFLHLMKFLKELKGLINRQQNNKHINQELDLTLDKVRTKLNEQIKNNLATKTSHKNTTNNNSNIRPHNQLETISDNKQTFFSKDVSIVMDKNSMELGGDQPKKIIFGDSKNTDLKTGADKKFSSKPETLNTSLQQGNKLGQFNDMKNSQFEKNVDPSNVNSTQGAVTKELNLENTQVRQAMTLTNKIDVASSLDTSNAQKPSVFSQENKDKLLQNLNMFSKTWGNKLIEKIEKSIVDGIEQLEIALTPKSLGRLNVTINLNDTVAKINIVAESAGAALLLGDAEYKLSQMMEASGLKLASLQTLTQHFGSNQKGKEHSHKLASTVKKSSIEDNSKSPETNNNRDSESEGLNLIA